MVYIKAAFFIQKGQSFPFSAVSSSSPLLFCKTTSARESSWSHKATKDLATLLLPSVKSLGSVWEQVVDEAIPPIPIPIPAGIPRPTSRGINWMALFGRICAARGLVRVWLLGTIFIWGVRKAKVQIPI